MPRRVLQAGLTTCAILVILLTFGCANAQNSPERETFRERLAARRQQNMADTVSASSLDLVTMTYQGRERSYYVHVPAALQGQAGLPAIVLFHGGEGDGRDAEAASRLSAAADADGFVAIYPNSPGMQWNDGRAETRSDVDDVGFVRALIAQAAQQQGVDPNRVFAAGMSNGGMFTQRLACEATGSFRAFAVVAANLPRDLQPSCAPSGAAPMIFFNGVADGLMPFDGGDISSMRSLGIGVGGAVLSHAATEQFWTASAACGPSAGVVALPDVADDGTTVSRETFPACGNGSTMEFYTIAGGGHNWPGSATEGRFAGTVSQDIDATQIIVDFFRRYGL